MSRDHGKKWPWIIMGSILIVVVFIYWTINVAINNPVQLSDAHMQYYQQFDRDANKIIAAQIEFEKKYELSYVTDHFKEDFAEVKFKVTDKAGNPVDSAKIRLMITRPNTHEFDMPLENPKVSAGVYTFERTVLPKPGRWDVLAHVSVGSDERFINLKADTRYPNVFEY